MPDPAHCQNMAELREMIDELDRDLVRRLTIRQACIDRAIQLKQQEELPARIPARVEDVVSKVRAEAILQGADADFLERIWRQLIDWSIAREADVLEKKAEK